MATRNPHLEEIWTIRGQDVEIISYRWEGHNIWGATARILKHFTEVLADGRDVHEFCPGEVPAL